jgi:hypothetical protein
VPAWETKLSFQVRDNYSCSEGSLTPQSASTGTGMRRRRRVGGFRRVRV